MDKIKKVQINGKLYDLEYLESLIDENIKASETVQEILENLDNSLLTVLIFKNSDSAIKETPRMKAYPPLGWSVTTSPLSSGLARYMSVGRMKNGVLLEWVPGSLEYWTLPVKISGGGADEYNPEIIYSAYKVGTDNTVLANFDRNQHSNPPAGFTNNANLIPNKGEYIYITTAKKIGDTWLTWTSGPDRGYIWSTPVKLGNDRTSESGTDIDGYNYAYYCTLEENDIPSIPTFSTDKLEELDAYHGLDSKGVISDKIIGVWYDHPQGISKERPFEWVAVSKPGDGNKYTSVSLWSKYGVNGRDGDGIEYIYTLVSDKVPLLESPYTGQVNGTGITYTADTSSSSYQQDDFIPIGWSDSPLSVNSLQPYLYISMRRKEWSEEEDKSLWGPFSQPLLWSNYAEAEELNIRSSISIYRTGTNESILEASLAWRFENQYPSGWSSVNSFEDQDAFVWMTTAETLNGDLVQLADGSYWSTPICVGGGSTSTIANDNDYFNYIFYRTNEADIVKIPKPKVDSTPEEYEKISSYDEDWGMLPNGFTEHDKNAPAWRDHPLGVSEKARFEYMCIYDYSKKEWGRVTLWSSFGVNGNDGDSVEYIFKSSEVLISTFNSNELLTNSAGSTVAIDSDEYLNDDFTPKGWTDNPVGVSEDTKYQYVAIRKKKGGKWGSFSQPTLWSSFGEDGENGVVDGYLLQCDNDNVVIDNNILEVNKDAFNELARATFELTKTDGSDFHCTYRIASSSTSVLKFNPTINSNTGELTYNVSSNVTIAEGEVYYTVVLALVDEKVIAQRKQTIYVSDYSSGESYRLNVLPNAIKVNKDNEFINDTRLSIGVIEIGRETTDISTLVGINSPNAKGLYYVIEKNGDSSQKVSSTLIGSEGDLAELYYVVNLYCNSILVDSETVSVYKDGSDGLPGYTLTVDNDSVILDDTITKDTADNVKTASKTKIHVYEGPFETFDWEFSAGNYKLPGLLPAFEGNTVYLVPSSSFNGMSEFPEGNYYYTILAKKLVGDTILLYSKVVKVIVHNFSSGELYKLTLINDVWYYSGLPVDGKYPILNNTSVCKAYVTKIENGKPSACSVRTLAVLPSTPDKETLYLIIPKLLNYTNFDYIAIAPPNNYPQISLYDIELYLGDTLVDAETINCLKSGKDGVSPDPLYNVSLTNDNVILDNNTSEYGLKLASMTEVEVFYGNTKIESGYEIEYETDAPFTIEEEDGSYYLKSTKDSLECGVYSVTYKVKINSTYISKTQTIQIGDFSAGEVYRLNISPNTLSYLNNNLNESKSLKVSVKCFSKNSSEEIKHFYVLEDGYGSITDGCEILNENDLFIAPSSEDWNSNEILFTFDSTTIGGPKGPVNVFESLKFKGYSLKEVTFILGKVTKSGYIILDEESINCVKDGRNGTGLNESGYVLKATPEVLIKKDDSFNSALDITAYHFNGDTYSYTGFTVKVDGLGDLVLDDEGKCTISAEDLWTHFRNEKTITVQLYTGNEEQKSVKVLEHIIVNIAETVLGISGAVLRFRGNWEEITAGGSVKFLHNAQDIDDLYYVDVVSYNKSYYLCKKTHDSGTGTNIIRPDDPNSIYWAEAAQFKFIVTESLMADWLKANTVNALDVIITEKSGDIVAGMTSSTSNNGNDNVRIWAGKTTTSEDKFDVSEAPFRVTNEGELFADRVNITGNINASSLNVINGARQPVMQITTMSEDLRGCDENGNPIFSRSEYPDGMPVIVISYNGDTYIAELKKSYRFDTRELGKFASPIEYRIIVDRLNPFDALTSGQIKLLKVCTRADVHEYLELDKYYSSEQSDYPTSKVDYIKNIRLVYSHSLYGLSHESGLNRINSDPRVRGIIPESWGDYLKLFDESAKDATISLGYMGGYAGPKNWLKNSATELLLRVCVEVLLDESGDATKTYHMDLW